MHEDQNWLSRQVDDLGMRRHYGSDGNVVYMVG